MSTNRKYHIDGTVPDPDSNLVWVFGSNRQGLHGIGAAAVAQNLFGAIRFKGEGHVGQSYGIPTRYWHDSISRIQTLPFEEVVENINRFVEYTIQNPHLHFFVTAVGCTNAGFKEEVIAPLFIDAINCSFPENWDTFMDTQESKETPEETKARWAATAEAKYKDFDPTKVEWLRYRFFTKSEDPRPIAWPPAGPYWVSGSSDDGTILIAYLPKDTPITDYWPEVTPPDIDFVQECPEGIVFSDRFAKPDYWPF